MKNIVIVLVEGLVVVELCATEILGIIKSEDLAIPIPIAIDISIHFTANALFPFPLLFIGADGLSGGVFEGGVCSALRS